MYNKVTTKEGVFLGIGERIKEVRKANKKTQRELAEILGLKRNTIANYEIGNVIPSERTILAICKEFCIREEWLKTGKGDMRIEMTVEDEIASFVANVVSEDSEFWKNFIVLLARMTPEERDVFEQKVREFAEMFGEK